MLNSTSTLHAVGSRPLPWSETGDPNTFPAVRKGYLAAIRSPFLIVNEILSLRAEVAKSGWTSEGLEFEYL
jgi:hypothetical protein